jgi:hypothetical protein
MATDRRQGDSSISFVVTTLLAPPTPRIVHLSDDVCVVRRSPVEYDEDLLMCRSELYDTGIAMPIVLSQ